MNKLLRIILLIILFVIVFLITKGTITFAYWYSTVYIIFTSFLALLICFKYDALKYIFEKTKKRKFLYSTIVIISFFVLINLIYYFGPKNYVIDDWYDLYYSQSKNAEKVLLSFIFIPEYYGDINILKMTLLESIFSFAFIIIAQLREKMEKKVKNYASITNYGVIGYVLDRVIKNIFRYKLFIIFFILVLTISSKYRYVYYVKMAGISILILSVICFIIKNYLSIKKCINKNKQKYGKDNLVIVASQDSREFSMLGDFINPLFKFYKYNTTSIGKSLLVDAKDYVFVSYDVIRYRLIKTTEYNAKSYVILLKNDIYLFVIDDYRMGIYQEKINKIIGNCDKFIIFPKFNFPGLQIKKENLKGKFLLRYRSKFDLKAIIEVLNLKEDDISLKEAVLDLFNSISQKENSDKNIYIKYSLNTILKSFNYIEYFYSLLKICEYIIHYLGLKDVINAPQKIIDKKIRVKDGGLSAWRDSINYDKTYNRTLAEDEKIISSLINLRKILEFKTEYNENYIFKFKKDLCKTIIDIRNNLLGHGVITYDVSERIVKYLFVVAKEFVNIFENIDITIEEDEEIKKIFAEDIKAIYKEDKFIYLYSKMNKNKSKDFPEYLNYETGKRMSNGNIFEMLDRIWAPSEIEETLGRFM